MLDNFELLVYVVEYLLRGHLPRSHLMRSSDCDCTPMLELQESWVPEVASPWEFLRYVRDRK